MVVKFGFARGEQFLRSGFVLGKQIFLLGENLGENFCFGFIRCATNQFLERDLHADIHVVGKSDRPDADRTAGDLKAMLALGVPLERSGSWRAPVLKICALSGDGVAILRETIDGHRAALEESGAIAARRAEINERRLILASEEAVRKAFSRQRDGRVAGILEELNARTIGPHTAARRLLEKLHEEDHR